MCFDLADRSDLITPTSDDHFGTGAPGTPPGANRQWQNIIPGRFHTPLVATLLCLLRLLTPADAGARPGPQGAKPQPSRARSIDVDRRTDAGEFILWQANDASFGNDQTTFGPGLLFPKSPATTMLFSGGLWLGAKVGGVPRVTVAEYSQEYGPGRILSGVAENPDLPELVVYKVTRFTGANADTAHLDRSPAELAANPALDPLVHHSWSEYVSGAGSRGAPVRTYRLPNTATPTPNDSVNVTGPDVKGDQMTWCVFNDADPLLHTNLAGGTTPLGVEVRRTIYTYSTPGILGSTAYMEYEIVNRSTQTLQDMLVTLWTDPDVGLPADDLVGTDKTLGLVYSYNKLDSDPAFGSRPPAVGLLVLNGRNLSSGDTLRTLSTSSFVNGTDPDLPARSYNYMLGLQRDGAPVIDPSTSLTTKFVFTGDPVAATGWRDTLASDKRMIITAGPATMGPGTTIKLNAALIVARGSSRLQSVALLKRFADFVRDRHLGVGRLPKSDLAIVHHDLQPVIHGCETTPAEFRVINFGPDAAPFNATWSLASLSGSSTQTMFNGLVPGLASGAAFERSIPVTLDETHLATDLQLSLSVDPAAVIFDINRANNSSLIATTHAVPDLQSLAQVSAGVLPQARIRFARSARDSVVTLSPVTQYEVYRRVDGAQPLAATTYRAAAALGAGMISDESILANGWDFVGLIPAHANPTYNLLVPTLPQVPSPSGYQAFLVRAATATPTLFFDSCVDSMPQVDSLPPLSPVNFRVTSVTSGGDVNLAWDAVTAPDLRQYRIYRGASQGFVPTTGNQLATLTSTSYFAPAPAPGSGLIWYKLSAVDFIGNVSPYAVIGSGTVDVQGDTAPIRFQLRRPAPNPFVRELLIPFDLPVASPVTLTIYDITGRTVRQALRGARVEAGHNQWRWDGRDASGRVTPPGVYLVRFQAGAFTTSARALRIH